MWHRALRMAAFWAGFTSCAAVALFLYFNNSTVTLTFWRWELKDVNIGMVALLPLAFGLATGYLYHLPARLHHVSEHMRHRRRVHELERELKDLRRGIDQVLEMPGDAPAKAPVREAKAVPALEAPKNGGRRDENPADLDAAMELPDEPPAEKRIKGPQPHAALPAKRAEAPKAAGRRRRPASKPPAPPAETPPPAQA